MKEKLSRVFKYYKVFGLVKTISFFLPTQILSRFIRREVEKIIISDNSLNNIQANSIDYMILVWGESYISTFLTYTIPSILQPGNAPKLKKFGFNQKFNIYTTNKEQFLKTAHQSPSFAKLASIIPIEIYENPLIENDPSYNQLKVNGLLSQLQKCIKINSILFNVNADFIFGNGTIFNLIKMAEHRNSCISFAHARVSLESFQKTEYLKLVNNQEPVENADLVGLAIDNLHHCYQNAYDDNDSNCTDMGVSLKKISEKIVAVTHALPGVFVFRPIQSDYDFFKFTNSYNEWDRGWNNKVLKESRLKVVGSSDLAFCIELFEDSEGVHNLKSGQIYNDNIPLARRTFPSRIFRQFQCVWRRS